MSPRRIIVPTFLLVLLLGAVWWLVRLTHPPLTPAVQVTWDPGERLEVEETILHCHYLGRSAAQVEDEAGVMEHYVCKGVPKNLLIDPLKEGKP